MSWSDDIEIRPIFGNRAHFEVEAYSGLTTGTVLALWNEKNPADQGFLALVESTSHATREKGRIPRGQYSFVEEVWWENVILGTLVMLATLRRVSISTPLEDSDEMTALEPFKYKVLISAHPPKEIMPVRLKAERASKNILSAYYTIPYVTGSDGKKFRASLSVGTLLVDNSVDVCFDAVGFKRHTALLAQSGSGKSYALGVLLEELIVATQARIVVIDPNGDFKSLPALTEEGRQSGGFASIFEQEIERVVTASSSDPAQYEDLATTIQDERTRGAIVDFNKLDPRLWTDTLLKILDVLWKHKDRRLPTIIVIDEAHNFAPETADLQSDQVLPRLIRIAGEGRKYGLWLIVASQRPQKLHPNIISQCDNLIVMKLTSRSDTSHIVSAFNAASQEMIELCYGFDIGEALAVGRIVRSPTMFKFRRRRTEEGGGDIGDDWARIPDRSRHAPD